MPSSTLTVILNANQSKRFALVLRSASAAGTETHTDAVLREARNKFRLKGLTTLYLKGGAPALADADFTLVHEVYIAKDEPYAGPSTDTDTGTSPAPMRILAAASFLDPKATAQLSALAALPGMRRVAGMPDLHPAARFPVGCALLCAGVYPALIGSDIGCGIALYRLAPPRAKGWKPEKLARMLVGLDGPWDGDCKAWLGRYGLATKPEWEDSLGTVGGGNHFAEICAVEEVVDPEVGASLALEEEALLLLVHTGSRGLGTQILSRQTAQTKESNPYLAPGSPELEAYLAEHDYAVRWAEANRDLVAHRIKRCIFPSGSNHLSNPDADDLDTDLDLPNPNHTLESEAENEDAPHANTMAEDEFMLEKLVDVTHNSVTRLVGSGGDEALWVHRKGAAPTDKGLTPCPGSRGDYSWILQPVGDGEINVHSLAHGAGRRYGRQALHSPALKPSKPKSASAASAQYSYSYTSASTSPFSAPQHQPPSLDDFPSSEAPSSQSTTTTKNAKAKVNANWKNGLTHTALGSEVVCLDPDLLLEERPEAYKDVGGVVEDMEMAGVARGVVRLRPVVSYKVREGAERRT